MTEIQTPSTQPNTDFASIGKTIRESAGIKEVEAPKVEAKSEPVKEEPKVEAKEEAKEEKPAPGTPDKEQQRLDQKLSSIEARLEKIAQIAEKSGTLTPEQIAKVEALTKEKTEVVSKIEGIAQKKPEEITTDDLHEFAKESAETTTKVSKEIEELTKRYDNLHSEFQNLRAEREWDNQQKVYPGIDHKGVWDKATLDAAKEVTDELAESGLELSEAQIETMAYTRARRLYASRADAAVKSKAAKDPVKEEPKTPPATAAMVQPKVTPGSAKVSVDVRSPAAGVKESSVPQITDYRQLGAEINKRFGS